MAEEQRTLAERVKNVGLIFFGAVIVVICLALFRSNVYIFTVFFCIYFGIYAVVVIVYLYRWANSGSREFNLLINISLYTVCLILSVAVFAIFLMNASAQYKAPLKF